MAIIFLENVSWFWFIYDEFNLKTTNSERLMIFIWNIFLSQSTFNTKNHLFLSTKVVRSFYLLNCTSACNFNSFETTKTLFFSYAICYFYREIFFHKLRFLLTLFFNKILRYIFNISITFCQIFERNNIWNISQNKNISEIRFNILIISIS